MAMDYTETLNLPKTEFSMRANLPTREPDMLAAMYEKDLYHAMLKRNEGKESFILHDGPPFSNGNIHMGTALNKVLKDFIVKSKSMQGYYAPYIPGWDNHGMPIESAIIKKTKLDRKKLSVAEFREKCHEFAQNFVDIQMSQFKRLGVLADWEAPYRTMTPDFEAREVKVFGKMFENGYIYKGLKPVYWCPKDETALAEAEIEYKDADCTSIYVKFKVKDDQGKLDGICDKDNTYFVIWTTTTWTLPGNVAIAVHPREKYSVVKTDKNENYILADALVEKTMAAAKIESFERIASFVGGDFEYMTAQHPFLDRDSLLVNAEYVTMESGTGCVHTAPGFGADDYVTGCRYKMDIIVPVDDKGYQTEAAGKFAGLYYEESNKVILEDLTASGALLASEKMTHQYPHCWRCKNPIIFRATPQWFCSVEAFRDEAVAACENVQWLPEWGGDRIKQMVRERADWCISRQRRWGLPIPVFYCNDCKKPVCTDETINSVAKTFGECGSNAWYDKSVEELLPNGFKCPHCGGTSFEKEIDTLDGWFDSGSSHFAVLDGNLELKWPSDIYLEGADQYRGWFQSSLLTAVGAKGEGAPYKTVLTHGWVVDGEGKAMHKSIGNVIVPEDMIKNYGADLVRLWVASSDYRVDVRISDPIFKQLSETYRKIRNTARIIMANLGTAETDFNPNTDMVDYAELYPIDKWILSRLNKVVRLVREAYDNYEFHIISHEINNFCTIDLSKLYIDITKDRVYTENKTSKARRSAQTAMYIVLNALARMIAPILAFTSDEIWQMMPHAAEDDARSALLNDMPSYDEKYVLADEEKWNKLFDIRDDVMKSLEEARASKLIGKSLDAKIKITVSDKDIYSLLEDFKADLATIFIVSQAEIEFSDVAIENGIATAVEQAEGDKCDRCWTYTKDSTLDSEGGHICARCRAIVGE